MIERGAGTDPLVLLSMLQLGDAFFPSGLYTLSHGLESLVHIGRVRTPEDLQEMLESYVVDVVGPSDAVAAAESLRAAGRGDLSALIAIDELLLALKLAYESRLSSQRTGRRLLALATRLTDGAQVWALERAVRDGRSPGTYAVALGTVAAAFGLDAEQAALVDLYSFATGLLGAALRCLRVDHAQVQSILRRLFPVLQEAAAVAAETPFLEMRSFAPAIEIAQMQHERADVRLFAS